MSPLLQPSPRAFIHYGFAVIAMGLYGGQVCPLVETLTMAQWLRELGLVLGVCFLLRIPIMEGYIRHIPPQYQVSRQFSMELILFFISGMTITLINQEIHGFPGLESGSKIILGITTLGFFAAVDLGLCRERRLTRQLSKNRTGIQVDTRYFPITVKFTAVAGTIALSGTLILLLVILKDINWMVTQGHENPWAIRLAIIKEITFVTLIFLIHTINIIVSYTRNLHQALAKENQALIKVSQGDLSSHVTVSSNDEFGIMAQYTNEMIATLRKNTQEIQQTRDATILALAGLAETRDNETGAHIRRTQNYVRILAEYLAKDPDFAHELSPETISLFHKSAPLHDIGKVGIPDAILLKEGKLTEDEYEIMKRHTHLGAEALAEAALSVRNNDFLKFAQTIALNHHEKWDGSGYPQGLSGENIPIPARLMALADVYDALISRRVYKKAFSHEKAKSIILDARESHFDPRVVDAFLDVEVQFTAIAKKFQDPPTHKDRATAPIIPPTDPAHSS